MSLYNVNVYEISETAEHVSLAFLGSTKIITMNSNILLTKRVTAVSAWDKYIPSSDIAAPMRGFQGYLIYGWFIFLSETAVHLNFNTQIPKKEILTINSQPRNGSFLYAIVLKENKS